jgi:hypothetical protein
MMPTKTSSMSGLPRAMSVISPPAARKAASSVLDIVEK